MEKNSPNSHCIVYRTGGKDNFKWNHSLAMSKDEAKEKKIEVEKMGYKCYIYKWHDLLGIGLPETYE